MPAFHNYARNGQITTKLDTTNTEVPSSLQVSLETIFKYGYCKRAKFKEHKEETKEIHCGDKQTKSAGNVVF